eukprot:m.81203 g.81203  ORF g.81203 m.81203 type:complete len:462 (-) comp25396_c0_seq1:137-1522(-)
MGNATSNVASNVANKVPSNKFSSWQKTLQDIRKNDPALVELDFTGFRLGEAKIATLTQALRSNTSVQKLNMTGTDCTAKAVQLLADTLVNSLFVCNIHTLILDNNPIGPDGAQYLGMAIGSSQTLLTLKVNGCGLGDDGAIAISRGMLSNKTITTLEMGNNQLGDRAAQAVAKMLKANDVLEGLSLWKNGILAGGAKYLFLTGLAANSSLQWLGLGGNNVGPEGAGYIATGLSTNEGLQWLAVGGNNIGDQGALKLAAVLKDDGCILQSIGLGGNDIGDVGMTHLCKAMWTNTFLESVGLGGNNIASEGCEHLSEMLKANKSLRKLIISSNLIDDDGVRAIADGMAINDVITTLLMAGNPFGDEGAKYLLDKLTNNQSKAVVKVLDIHNSNMSEGIERAFIEKARNESKLVLLGSEFGRRDHRILRNGEDENVLDKKYSAFASPTFEKRVSASSVRGEENF